MAKRLTGWHREFVDPRCPTRRLITQRDAASYITGPPNKEADFPEWQAAIETLMLVELSGPTMFGRIGGDAGIEPRPRSGL